MWRLLVLILTFFSLFCFKLPHNFDKFIVLSDLYVAFSSIIAHCTQFSCSRILCEFDFYCNPLTGRLSIYDLYYMWIQSMYLSVYTLPFIQLKHHFTRNYIRIYTQIGKHMHILYLNRTSKRSKEKHEMSRI